MSRYPIYLDYNATTPVDREVVEAMLPYWYEHFGNPSSSHAYGRVARKAVERARSQVAALLGCEPEDVIFTSGGSESNNSVIKGVAEAHKARKGQIIISAIEHPAVLEPCASLAEQGYTVTTLPVDALGRVSPEEVERVIRPETILVSILLANNEVGTVQPIAEIAHIARAHGVPIHTDAAQAVGKTPVDVEALGVDFLSVAGHKFYAPKGVGALYVRRGTPLPPFMHGATQESGRRAGTENVPEIVGLGAAAEVAGRDLSRNMAHMRAMRDRLYGGLSRRIDDVRSNGDLENGLPNTLSLSFRGIEANLLLGRIGGQVAASAGAACHADQIAISTVLQAMRIPTEYAMGTLRFSVGKMTTGDEIDTAIEVIVEAVRALRGT